MQDLDWGKRSPQNTKLRGKLCYEMLLWRQSASEFWRLFAWLSVAQRQVLSLLVSVIGRGQRHEQETVSTRLVSKMQCLWRNAMQHISVSGEKTWTGSNLEIMLLCPQVLHVKVKDCLAGASNS